jgi:hypothetical protein
LVKNFIDASIKYLYMQVTKNKGGRPTKYEHEYADQAKKLCFLGFIDRELAGFFEVEESTINKWKKDYPEFLES